MRNLTTSPRLLLAAVLALLGCCASFAASAARASDGIYWSGYANPGPIRVGNLSGPGTQTLFSAENSPQGIAIDATTGKIYWASTGANAIRVANLDGTGAHDLVTGENQPSGVAVDPAGGKLYWSDYGNGTIRVANLDGTGVTTLFSGESDPTGVAIDPAGGRIYWGSYNTFVIRSGSLAGGTAVTLFTGENYPVGVALDRAAGRLYWTNEFAGNIRTGKISDPSSARNLFTGETGAGGIAIDPDAGKIYWAVYSPGAVRIGNLDGSGTAQSLYTGETNPWFVTLLRAPAAAGVPTLSGGDGVGQTLTCIPGQWAPDVLGGYLYRAPQSTAFQWLRDGASIGGATTASYTPFAPGGYSCKVTATNFAGSTSQTSAVRSVTAGGGSGGGTDSGGTGGGTTSTPPKGQVAGNAVMSWDRLKDGRTRLRTLVVDSLTGPETVKLTCTTKARGCRKSATKTVKKHGRKVTLSTAVKGMTLRPTAVVTVTITRAGYTARVFRYTMKFRADPQKLTRCRKPGKTKLTIC